ncbi:efflux RND transporter periplasmic adaptor subunit [Shewanella sp. Scap07]|uniref:efflux RND transporter periplasmic adaptor subunit n=1 Tax=Shewanella sp. Scap07 TaxID=2589987 RepID=UPI0015BA965A|nr:efflux RND transporter periplasmic adaptor subunit [Shewanella sp. Scap07]QLE83929.1 efflux RND transporter periplasmic adaptor subunit [Shewanella sp. Scap07]
MKSVILYLIAVCLLSTSVIAEERKRAPSNVITEALSFQSIQFTIETVGTAQAHKSVSLYSAASDKVTNITFEPGDFVEKGTLLMELDARRQLAALQRAKIALADTQRDVQRLVKSQASGAATESEVDKAKLLHGLAQVAVAEAEADMEDRSLVAPFSGYLGLVDIEVGDRINQSTLITTIDDRQQLYINFTVPESSYRLVATNTEVTVEPWHDRGEIYQASLAQLDSRIDANNRTLKVRALLDNQEDLFRPGLSFKVTLNTQGALYPVVPESALAWGATGSYIWLEKDGKAVKKSVAIKQRLRGSILVEGDLQDGDTLIVEGIQRLREGAEVASKSMLVSGQ